MNLTNPVPPILKIKLDNNIKVIQARMRAKNRNATYKHSKSFKWAYILSRNDVTFKLLGLKDYYLENGRSGNNRQPPVNAIYKWIDDKRIAYKDEKEHNSMAWAISKSIAKKGTSLYRRKMHDNLYDDFFDDKTKKLISSCIVNDYNMQLNKKIKQLNKHFK